MIMQEFKHLPPKDTLPHDIERLRIAFRRLAVAVLRVVGVESAAHMRARLNRDLRRTAARGRVSNWLTQGRDGFDGRSA